ncbi:MAG: hypothetical protein COB20_13885 [SAR86 cluster bacterium]|uniref:HTH luxR-type domain-containing protein n=1 Tax=SAR86 cluster bacterium TaxID=2030880 RepID=A0A2A4WYX7_9GAMM|nr:MAG: hypothetical protein COB20_13885 [SAR86 cluster bacterium]
MDTIRKERIVAVIHGNRFVREKIAQSLRDCATFSEVLIFPRLSTSTTELKIIRPGVLILDVTTQNDMADLRLASASFPHLSIVVWGLPLSEQSIIQYAKHGVAGYVTSEDSATQLVEAAEGAYRGELPNPKVAGMLNRYISNFRPRVSVKEPDVPDHSCHKLKPRGQSISSLTSRETDVIELISEGLSNKEIARILSVEISTVKNHVHSILTKFQVDRRYMAAAHYRSHDFRQASS